MYIRLRNPNTHSVCRLHSTAVQDRGSLLLSREVSWWLRDPVRDPNEEPNDHTDTSGTVRERSVRRDLCDLSPMYSRHGLSGGTLLPWNL